MKTTHNIGDVTYYGSAGEALSAAGEAGIMGDHCVLHNVE